MSIPVLLDRTAGGADQTDAITIKGDGIGTSELRADTGFPAGKSLIESNLADGKYVQILSISDASLRGGQNCLRINTASRTNIERVKVEAATDSCIYVDNSWVNIYSGILSNLNGGSGIEFSSSKQKTSTLINGGYALKNSNDGWVFGFMNYSAAIATASDQNSFNGYHLKKCDCFMLVAPGCEGNGRAGAYIEASATIGPTQSTVIEAAFFHNNDQTNSGWANLAHLKSTDGTKCVVVVKNSTADSSRVNGTADVYVDGVGAIAIVDNCVLPNGVNTVNGGYIDWVHHPLLVNGISYGAGSARTICLLRSTQGYANTYGGRITVHASNADPSQKGRRTATYELLVNKTSDGTIQIVEVAKAGETLGSTNNSPSFSWSVNSNNQLVGSTLTSTIAGNFWFEITTNGQVIAHKI